MKVVHLSQEYQHIVRIIGNDIPGEKNIVVGLTQIRGVGYMFANAILNSLKINRNNNIGHLTNEQVQQIEKMIKDPQSANFPKWFLNRRKDIESGNDLHLITSDIGLTVRNDIERERVLSSWRGYRHMFGLKVRGQRTRCTGRKGGAVGVKKGGKVMPAGAAGAPGAPAAEGAAAETPATTEAPAKTAAAGAEKKAAPAPDKKAEAPKGEKK